jgi:hypothetical protein
MEFPGMAEGKWLGARTKDGLFEWRPFQVVYTHGTRSPVFEYILHRYKMDVSKGIYPAYNLQSSLQILVEEPLVEPF